MSASAKRRAEVQITDQDGTDSSGDEGTDGNKVGFYDKSGLELKKKWEKADASILAARR